jgi:arylsulfatase A-like enzyme
MRGKHTAATLLAVAFAAAGVANAAAAAPDPQPFGAEWPGLDGWAVGEWWQAPPPAKPGAKGAKPFALDVPRADVVAFALYTVTVRPAGPATLKLTAQLFPLLADEPREARLEIRRGDDWVEVARAAVHYPGWDVNFRVESWDASRDWPYRVRHGAEAVFAGLVRRDPADKPAISVAILSCNSSSTTGPREEIVAGLRAADPDLLFFAGDQTYRHTQHTTGWIEFGLQFRDVLRDRPAVTIPDDHDVGHPNLWGAGGKRAFDKNGSDGGYFYPPAYVNMVHRQQTWHLPDPVDPVPMDRGISVYFTRLLLGGIDFAILEDRAFKTGPAGTVPQLGPRPDHITDPAYDRRAIDLPGLELLGSRQLAWLDRWSREWEGARGKCVLSQTAFCGAVHLHGSRDNRLLADLDCNGWPQRGRNAALEILRRARAPHLCGDQHLAVVVQHGIEAHRDGPWSFTAPAIVNTVYGRWWHPLDEKPGVNPVPDSPLPWTGDYEDGLGNKITVAAYANPRDVADERQRGDGYGIARFEPAAGRLSFECWPRFPDPGPDGRPRQYPGWPVTVPFAGPPAGAAAPSAAPRAAPATASATPARPNVIVVLVDDMGWRDLSCQGSDYFETPHVDRLAARGMRFTRGYSACTVCSPTRAAILTGQYPARLHVTDWIPGHARPFAPLAVPAWRQLLAPETVTIAERLRAAGYATASIGKWHLGDEDNFPEVHGFDRNVGGTSRGQPPSYFSPYKIPTLPDGPAGEYLTDREAAEAEAFIVAHRDRPFFLYLPHYCVHTPIQAKPDVAARFAAKEAADTDPRNPAYAAMVSSVDDCMGKLLATLDRLGIADRTAIFFTSDNGGLAGITDTSPLRAGKGSAYEGGVRVPFIVSWPGLTPPGSTCDVPVITPDIPATVIDVVGLGSTASNTAEPAGKDTQPAGADPLLDGASLAPLFRGGRLDRDAIYWHYPHYHPGGATPYSAIRADDWRLVHFYTLDRRELYNLCTDEGETRDLAAAEPARVVELSDRLDRWLADVGAQLPAPNPAADPARDVPAARRRPADGRKNDAARAEAAKPAGNKDDGTKDDGTKDDANTPPAGGRPDEKRGDDAAAAKPGPPRAAGEQDMRRPLMVSEAALPAGFPAPGPVDRVIVKTYPAHRLARATAGAAANGMFMKLFRHIERNKIAMTAPVVMDWPAAGDADGGAGADGGVGPRAKQREPEAMAFLYREPSIGAAGADPADPAVVVADVPETVVVSIGLRGGYGEDTVNRGLEKLREWLAAHPEWTVAGPPRSLGYNSPFVPDFAKYSEAQIPVVPTPPRP